MLGWNSQGDSAFCFLCLCSLPQLGQEGQVPLKSGRLFFELSEKVRKILESYFRLETTLYFSYTHLVCRSAIDGEQEPQPLVMDFIYINFHISKHSDT